MPDGRCGKTYSFDVCANCKISCCRGANPPLTLERKKIICDYRRERQMPSENVFINENYCHPYADQEDFCAFFDKGTGKCSVHPVKPETCKAGPVTFDINLKTGKVEWFLKKGNVCALAEQLYQCSEKFEEHFEAARTELLGLICGLDGEALKAILRIPEPETFKVGDEELPEGVAEKLGVMGSSSD